jgi:hypothetical protein
MSFDIATPNETRSIRAASLHRRLGSVCTEILVSVVVIASICAIALMIGTNAASAATRNLIMVDDGIGAGAIFAVVGVTILFMVLAPFVFNGLTPGHVRRRRARR